MCSSGRLMTNAALVFILWARPAGRTDSLDEQPLTSFPLTAAECDVVERHATEAGWHSFRRERETCAVPNFAKAVR